MVVVVGMAATLQFGAGRPAAAAGGTVTDQRIGVLSSFFPSERDFSGSTRPMWNRLAQVGSDVGLVVIVENTIPSIDYKDFVEREQGVGQTVLGTVSSFQSEAAMVASASFQRTQFGVTGVLLRTYAGPCGVGNEPSSSLIANLRGLGFTTIAVETTGVPSACYASLADILLTFDGSLAAYGSGPARPPWLTGAAPALWHVVYGVASGQVASVVATAKAAGADFVFTTADVLHESASTIIPDASYWDALRSAVRGSAVDGATETFPTADRETIGIPLFGNGNPAWDTVSVAPAAELATIVVNAENGAGTSPDAGLVARINAAKAAGRRVLGYVPLGYTPTGSASRSDSAILLDVTRWRDFYGVNGIFLDEVQPQCSVPGYGDVAATYAALAASMRSIIPGGFLALNPGRNIGECFAAAFDAIVTFEGPASAYASWTPSRWQDRWPTKQFWQLVYDAPTTDVAGIVTQAACRNADVVYVTSQNAGSLWLGAIDPTYFASVRAAVASRPRCALPTARAAVVTLRGPTVTAPGSGPMATRTTAPGAAASSDAGVVIRLDPPTPTSPSAPTIEHLALSPAVTSSAAPVEVARVAPPRVAVRLAVPVTSVTA